MDAGQTPLDAGSGVLDVERIPLDARGGVLDAERTPLDAETWAILVLNSLRYVGIKKSRRHLIMFSCLTLIEPVLSLPKPK